MGKSNEVGAIPYEKSNNVETSLFYIQGRITRKDFFLRSFLCVILWGLVHLSFLYLETPNYNEWVERGGGKIQSGAVQVELRHKIVQNIDYYFLPSMLMLFLLIQSAKRVHDTNHSSKCLLIPFYNVYLLFSEGSPNDNDYGLLPHAEVKSPSYKAEQTETIRNHKYTPNKIKTKKLNINWDDVLGWTVIGGFIVSILLNIIAPWFMSGLSTWMRIVFVVATILGTYMVIYALDDNHKGKYVAALGWGGAIVVLLFTILTIYGICGGFSSTDVQNADISHDYNQNVQTLSSEPVVPPQSTNMIPKSADTMIKIKEKKNQAHPTLNPKKSDKSSHPSQISEQQELSRSAF